MNTLQRDALLRQASEAMGAQARSLLTQYHKASLASITDALVHAPIENVPALQAEARLHMGILSTLTTGA